MTYTFIKDPKLRFSEFNYSSNIHCHHATIKVCINFSNFVTQTLLFLKVTGYVHISTQKTDVKVAKIVLEVTGTLNAWVKYYPKNKKTQVKLENVSY